VRRLHGVPGGVGAAPGIDEDFYEHVAAYHDDDRYSPQERLAIEYAERFALDHTNIDERFFARLREHFDDGEILDLTVCLAAFLGLGRVLNVLGIEETCLVDVYAPSEGDRGVAVS
jgi:alkylhydroperoxidase family enzyme